MRGPVLIMKPIVRLVREQGIYAGPDLIYGSAQFYWDTGALPIALDHAGAMGYLRGPR